jgi:CBS domain-containing protein
MANVVSQLMTPDPVLVDVGTDVRECAKLMERHAIGALGVTREGKLVGVLTDRDIVLRVIACDRDPTAVLVGDVGSADPVTIPADAPVKEAERRMRDYAVRRLFVVGDEGRTVGILTVDDLAALRDPDSVPAHQIREWTLGRSDMGMD